MAAACGDIVVLMPPLRPLDGLTQEWFAVQVRSGREQLCAQHLRARGYEIFLPCYLEHRRWSDRVKRIERALFSGYIFGRFTIHVAGKIVTTDGVVRIVGDSAGPLSIPAFEIEAIRRVVDTRLMVEPWPFLHAGDRVRVDVGPLRDTEGIVIRVKDRHRLIVSIALLQRSVAVELDLDWISIPPARLIEQPYAN